MCVRALSRQITLKARARGWVSLFSLVFPLNKHPLVSTLINNHSVQTTEAD